MQFGILFVIWYGIFDMFEVHVRRICGMQFHSIIHDCGAAARIGVVNETTRNNKNELFRIPENISLEIFAIDYYTIIHTVAQSNVSVSASADTSLTVYIYWIYSNCFIATLLYVCV